MSLTGTVEGPPLSAPGDPAGYLRSRLDEYRRHCMDRTGREPSAPDVSLLSERAAAAGFQRQAPVSCGGAFRAVRTLDGWFGLSLARASDRAAVPALCEVAGVDDPWRTITEWAATGTSRQCVDRARLLGLATSTWPPAPSTRPAVVRESGGRRRRAERPLVIDFTALWAGPLCAHLLELAGCDVVKIESVVRPDGARRGPSGFFDTLHAGHDSVTVDFESTDEVARLRDLVARADVVLEASRPRALRRLGIDARDVVADGIVWVSITAAGRDEDRIGFGDDIAVGAGLAIAEEGMLMPVGDALADPLTGVAAAAAAAAQLGADRAALIDVSMHDVAAEAAARPSAEHEVELFAGTWWVTDEVGRHAVREPRARRAPYRAAEAGRDNASWLR